MVNPTTFKIKIEEILSQEYTVEFLGKNIDHIINLLTETRAEKIYQWVEHVVAQKIQPILVGSSKSYKNWMINQLVTFRYPFTIKNNEYRILLVKVKNEIYIEFHLGDHKYYDKVRKDLDLKKSSY